MVLSGSWLAGRSGIARAVGTVVISPLTVSVAWTSTLGIVSVVAVVLLFRSSDRLAAAYGVAVAFTMLTTTSVYLVLDRVRGEHHPLRRTAAYGGLGVMVVFCAAALPKIPRGGWAPVLIGALVPLALRGVKYRPIGAGPLLARNLAVYGIGGVIAPFLGIKAIDLLVSGLGLA